jgi:hypothetical protein
MNRVQGGDGVLLENMTVGQPANIFMSFFKPEEESAEV